LPAPPVASCQLPVPSRNAVLELETGNWKLKTGNWKLEAENWKLETGSWKLEAGNWKLETGNWKLETDSKAAAVNRKPNSVPAFVRRRALRRFGGTTAR
jgi:hypothetical protein